MINIHNIMEEQVIDRVNKIYDQVMSKQTTWLSCDCENCRLDTVSYVLNRIPPRYVVSGRGVTHSNSTILKNSQINADIDKLAIEGMRLVSSSKRPYHKDGRKHPTEMPKSKALVFNFPNFIGNVYDGSTFEPLTDAQIELKLNNKLAEMMDVTWPNPCKTFKATNGGFTFWVAPEKTDREGLTKDFNFTINVNCQGYVPATIAFTVTLTSEAQDRREVNASYSRKINDIFLFRNDIENEME